jgi:large subunit ribosomal protein L3
MTVIKGLLGRKIGMTQIFKESKALPVTVISAGPCYVMAVKKKDIDGYDALKLGYEQIKPKKKGLIKPRVGEFSKLKLKILRDVREIRIEDSAVLDNYKVGQELKVNIFKQGEFLDITARSKGKGFQGGVKRWGWSIGPKSHGSRSHRAIGSIGQSSDPSRVFKGLHMAGHMGDDKVTVQNIEIIDLDLENNLILVKGSIPGARNSKVILKSAKKKDSDFSSLQELKKTEESGEDREPEQKEEDSEKNNPEEIEAKADSENLEAKKEEEQISIEPEKEEKKDRKVKKEESEESKDSDKDSSGTEEQEDESRNLLDNKDISESEKEEDRTSEAEDKEAVDKEDRDKKNEEPK